jgi:hypothetical protein
MLDAFRRRQSPQSQLTAPGPRNNLFQQIFAVRRDPLGMLLDAQHRYGDIVRFEALGYVGHLLAILMRSGTFCKRIAETIPRVSATI